MLHKRLVYPRCHKVVKGGDCLTTVLLILIGLENDRCESGVALDALRSADTPILCVETPFVEILQIVLYTSSGLGGVVVEVVNMDIPTPVCFGKFGGE